MGQGGALSQGWSTDPRIILNTYFIISKKENILKAQGSQNPLILFICTYETLDTESWQYNSEATTLEVEWI